MNIPLHGIFSPMITPFKENGAVDYDSFVRNIERWNSTELSGYLVLGSNSEAPFLTTEEKLKLIELTGKSTRKEKIIFAGTGLESTKDTITLTNKSAQLGAHIALILTPCYYREQMTDNALINHFTAVADASDIPILIYNVPKFTHLNVSVEVVQVLSQHPNIVGMKDSSGNILQLKAIKDAVSKDFNLIVGTASILYFALELGIRAGILALSNCAPNECAEIQQLFENGKLHAAQRLKNKLLPVNKAVTETFGIAGLKYASTLRGYEGGYVRSPLLSLSNEDKIFIRNVLIDADLLDEEK